MSLELVIKENTEVIRQLIATMQKGKTFTPDTSPQPKTECTDKRTTGEKPCLDDQPLPVAVALAALYGASGRELDLDKLAAAVEVTETATGKDRNETIDTLTMALKGVKRATQLHGTGVFDLAIQILEHWDALPGITERRAYAERLLDTPKAERANVKPAKPKTTEKKQPVSETKTDEPIPDVAALMEQGRTLIIEKLAPETPAELRKTLDKFGLKKLTDCPHEKLPEVIAALTQLADSLEA